MPLGINHKCRSGECHHLSMTDCFDKLCEYIDKLERTGVERRSRIKTLQVGNAALVEALEEAKCYVNKYSPEPVGYLSVKIDNALAKAKSKGDLK